MNCPICGSSDLREYGNVRGAQILRCRLCGEYLERTVKLVRLTKREVKRALL